MDAIIGVRYIDVDGSFLLLMRISSPFLRAKDLPTYLLVMRNCSCLLSCT